MQDFSLRFRSKVSYYFLCMFMFGVTASFFRFKSCTYTDRACDFLVLPGSLQQGPI